MRPSYVKRILAEYEIPSTPELMKLIITQSDEITIPNRALNNLKYVPKRELRTVHEEMITAKELILITLSNLSNTWILAQQSDDENVQRGYKRLCSKILEEQVKYDPNRSSPYCRILELLKKHDFIERGDAGCSAKGKCTEYKLTNKYFGRGCHPYKLHSTTVRRMHRRRYTRNFEMVVQTQIGRNHLKMLTKVHWPSEELVSKTISEAVKDGYTNKRNMRLIKLGKHSKSEYPQKKFIYAEDYLRSFQYLKDNMKMPIMKEEWLKDGELQFRIATCFTGMPKLLRKLVNIGDEKIVESDYSALHPNIVQMLYGGTNIRPITHGGVADYLTGLTGIEVSRDAAKDEHLSFFNKKVYLMKKSPLWEYYWNNEKEMLGNVIEQKRTHKKGHKATCWELFAVEVKLMEEGIKRLNELGVDVIYVYDALYSIKKEQETVRRVMNEVAQEHKILSRVK